jgi:hypothetical protein
MEFIHANPRCRCMRCRVSGLMVPAVLITLGLLFLLQETGVKHFNQTWPLVLIVIGVVQIVKRSAPSDEHVERGYEAYAMAQQQSPSAVVTPPPVPSAGQLPPPSNSHGSTNDGIEEAHNG